MKDPYEILGVARSAPADEIKKAYRRLAKKYHPDVNKEKGAEERFKEISQAYDVLGNAEKRKKYDQFGQWAERGGFDPSQVHRTYTWTSGGPGGGFDFGDLFGGRGGPEGFDLGDLFGDLFGAGGRRGRARRGSHDFQGFDEPARGKDLYAEVEIDFALAARGLKQRITVNRNGAAERLDVKIPAGVRNGTKIRLAGKGEEGLQGPGDLYIRINIRPHPEFWREDDDVYIEVPLSITEAALGTTVEVPTLEGQVSLKVPPGTSGGQKFRLKGRGFPQMNGKGRGDQFVVVAIKTPKDLSQRAKELFKELARELK